MIRVLYVHRGGDYLAGGERSLLALLDHCRHAVQPHVATYSRAILREAAARGIEGTFGEMVGLSRPSKLARRFDPWRRSVAVLMRRIRRFRPHIVHANNFWPCQVSVIAARLCGVPVVCHARAAISRPFLEVSLRRWCHAVIGISEFTAAPYRRMRLTTARVFVVHNPIAGTCRDHAPPRRGGAVELLFGGRLMWEKGPDQAIALVGWLARQGLDVRLSCFGAGDWLAHLQDLARREGVAGRVAFRGFADDLPDHLARADALLVPSRREGLGRVVVEAALTGTPAVASNVGGLPETMIDGETGLLIGDWGADGERRKVLGLLRDRERCRRMGEAGRRFCQMRFDPDVAAARTLEVYRYVLSRTGQPAEELLPPAGGAAPTAPGA